MKFDNMIGGGVFVYFRNPFIITEGSEQQQHTFGGIGGTLLGVEASGIWMESKDLGAVFDRMLWENQLREGGLDAVGSASIGYFIPFTEVRCILGLREKREGPL